MTDSHIDDAIAIAGLEDLVIDDDASERVYDIEDDFEPEDPNKYYDEGFFTTCYSGGFGMKPNPYPDGDRRNSEFSRGQLDGVIDYERCREIEDMDSWSWGDYED